MSVVTGALGSLATKLLRLLSDEYKLQKGVRKQVQWLHRELESIYAFLSKISDVPWDRLDEQVKVWAREVREASYDMEDVLDTFLVRVDDGGAGESADSSRLKRAMNKMGKLFGKAKARHGIAGAIDDIKKHLEEVAQRRQKYKLDDIICKPLATTSSIDPRLKVMYKEVTQLIGVNKSRDELISMLDLSQPDHDASNKKMKKVSIVGVGGLGKTTLAKVVYDMLKSQYDYGAFVSVGRDRDMVKVIKDILFLLDEKKHEKIHETTRGIDLLIRQLREFLEEKRYFIVIDDVWEVRSWETIELALAENNCGSKVITTTRNVDVAKAAGEVYKLKPLSYDDSMKLFYMRIFGEDGKYLDNQPDDITSKILMKCGGIPLAIIAMTSLLVGKSKYEWSEVYSSIGFGSKGNREVEDTMTIILFSYYDLPPYLRTCLLYLSAYPEDYVIKKDSLIWKWISEGFINENQGIRLFELGEKYFNDLINRSLIQAVENKFDGIVAGCRVHDMVLDLMRKISFEENFLALLGGNNVEGTPAPSSARRLAHQNIIVENINSEATDIETPKVRSYIAFMCFISNLDHLLRFKLLRVLDIVKCDFKEGCHLEHIGDLVHLRYLGIRNRFRAPNLPEQIGSLKLLKTLDVDGLKLPSSIVQLTQLVRLCARDAYAPDGIGNLTSLEELIIGGPPGRFMKELGSLGELRVLKMSIDGMMESTQRDFIESLRNLKKIQHIFVHGSCTHADTIMWDAAGFDLARSLSYLDLFTAFSKLPSCISPSCLPNLSHLRLWVATMDEQDLKLLARLPALCYLNLETWSTVTASNINASDGCFFQKLRYFRFGAMVQFEQQLNEDDASISLHLWNGRRAMPFGSGKSKDSSKIAPCGVMPNLEVLHFYVPLKALKHNNGDCGNTGLQYLPSLQHLNLEIICDDLSAEEVDAALAALANTCKVHPNHPTVDMKKIQAKKFHIFSVSEEFSAGF